MKFSFFVLMSVLIFLFCTIAEGKHKRLRSKKHSIPIKYSSNIKKIERLEDDSDNKNNKDSKSSSIAFKAAQEAKEAQEAQMVAGAQAALQVKVQLAEKAQQAAKAAEAALMGKQAMVEQLEKEVREAEAVAQEESASCQQTQVNLELALAAANEACVMVKALTGAVQCAQGTLENTQKVAAGAQQELSEKAAIKDAAKWRVETLLKDLSSARKDLSAIKQATYKAQQAAKSAETNAQKLPKGDTEISFKLGTRRKLHPRMCRFRRKKNR